MRQAIASGAPAKMVVLAASGEKRSQLGSGVQHDGRERGLVVARHFELEQRAAFGAGEFPQLQLGVEREMRPAGLRRHHATVRARLPVFARRTDYAELSIMRSGGS